MNMWIKIFKTWQKWRKDWDSLCNCCGKCCYRRSVREDGQVIIYYDSPCENLDEKTHLCKIYDERFIKCKHCGKVSLFTALFNPTLPNDCPYRKMFRLWDRSNFDD